MKNEVEILKKEGEKLDEKTNLLPGVRPGVGDVPKGSPVLLLASASHGILLLFGGREVWLGEGGGIGERKRLREFLGSFLVEK